MTVANANVSVTRGKVRYVRCGGLILYYFVTHLFHQ